MQDEIVIPIAGMIMVILIVLEQAMDSMSLEIERMAEGQRFTTRLLAERMGVEAAVPRGDVLRDSESSGGR